MSFECPEIPMPGEPGSRIGIDGTLNFRELGGYQAADGRVIRSGRVFRSDHLNAVSDAGVAEMERLGIRTVIDLRFAGERERQPSRVPRGVVTVLADASGMEAADYADRLRQFGAGQTYSADDAAADYRLMADSGANLVIETLTALAQSERQPLLFHCTAGKDRTGLTASLLLRVLGVPDATVMHDYLLTNVYRAPTRIAEMTPVLAEQGVDINDVIGIFVANRVALAAVLDDIDAEGGTEAFLLSRGLASHVPAQLRSDLLV
jgi:protein-tyrosine phosphatase